MGKVQTEEDPIFLLSAPFSVTFFVAFLRPRGLARGRPKLGIVVHCRSGCGAHWSGANISFATRVVSLRTLLFRLHSTGANKAVVQILVIVQIEEDPICLLSTPLSL
jgi:hypothetical protein